MTDDQKEAAEERTAICRLEKVSEEEINWILISYPEIYGERA
jgi:hypothetical protein